MMLPRRALLALPLLALAHPVLAAVSPEEAEAIGRVETYLNGITTLRAEFTQLNPDGSTANGDLFLDRGHHGMRIDYAPPSKLLLIATDWRLIYYDGSIKQVNVIPLARTPLGFLLDEEVKLGGAIEVTGVRERPGEVDIGLARPQAREEGSVVVTFALLPMALRSWVVTDAQGLETRLVLENVRTGEPLDRSLFVWRDPKLFGYPKDD
jgi:outer membrane lipoprotein-sorting protein